MVRFSLEPVKDEAASEKEGRPIFREVEYVEIMVPGDKSSIVKRALRDTDKKRFRRQYAAWKETGNDAALIGMPLAQWPQVTKAQVEELRYFGVHTVEQLAGVSDGNIRNIGPVMELRQRARDYVEAAKGNAPLGQLRAELEEKNHQLEALQRQVKELGAALDDLKKKRKD